MSGSNAGYVDGAVYGGIFSWKSDLSRMASQVISGVGFLGVGTIIVSGHQVRGLTTAASLWACACVGLAVGIGFLDGGVIITVCVLISLHVLPRLEKYFFGAVNIYPSMWNWKPMEAFLNFWKNFRRIRYR